MIDKETADVIAIALFNEELVGLDSETLDELAILKFFDDEDIEFEDLDYTQEAGLNGHGINTEEEMLYTWSGQ